MIYLDNSSTTHKKPNCVKRAVIRAIKKENLNPSRASYKKAMLLSEKIYRCRELLASHFGTVEDNVIFTSGCTEALNLAIKGTIKNNGHIITTIFEHNSVLRVLEEIKHSHNITYTTISPRKNGKINSNDIINEINPRTYMIIINHTSNVNGAIQNIENIGKIAKKYNLIFLVDGAQSVGHEYINMEKQNINLLTIAGHKGLYAPQGIGCLLTRNISVSPIKQGGTGTFSNKVKQPKQSPEGLESGTPNIIGILGLYKGAQYVFKKQYTINKKISNLTKYTLEELNKIKNVTTYSSETRSGIISLIITSKDSSMVTDILDEKYNIATRSGLHCAPLFHKFYKTLNNGMTRISLSYFNTKREVTKLIKAIKEIALDK